MTVTIQIGNSDDKLPKKNWALFIQAIYAAIAWVPDAQIHFSGGSLPNCPWQNFCWVVMVPDGDVENLKKDVGGIGKKFFQDSVAFSTGQTQFV